MRAQSIGVAVALLLVAVIAITALSILTSKTNPQVTPQPTQPVLTQTPTASPATSTTPTPIFASPQPTQTASPEPNSTLPPTTEPTLTPNLTPTPTATQEKVRDSVMDFIKSNHLETAQFLNGLVWTGGRTTPPDHVGAETYMYYSSGWNVTITYPVVPNAIYKIVADFSAIGVAIPYRIIWDGTWQNEVISESSYVFAQ
jgi:hypothetical protein